MGSPPLRKIAGMGQSIAPKKIQSRGDSLGVQLGSKQNRRNRLAGPSALMISMRPRSWAASPGCDGERSELARVRGALGEYSGAYTVRTMREGGPERRPAR